jgi:branched-chain amino acid aminotransferase
LKSGERIMMKPQFFNGTNWIWMNGQLVAWDNATTHVSAHALHYGTGIFEGIRSYKTAHGPCIFRLDSHLNRFVESAAAYEMPLPYSQQTLSEAVCQVIKANLLQGNSYIRLLSWYGSHDMGITSRRWPVETAIIAWPWGILFGDDRSRYGIRVSICPWRKIHFSMLPTSAKACGQYLSSLLAAQYAIKQGCDEALLLDATGNIAEGPAENIFLVKDGRLVTNDESSSILLGITRESVLSIAQNLGLSVEVRHLTPEDLFHADEAFFTGTAAEIVSIREVDGKLIGIPGCHPVTDQIHEVFNRITAGLDTAYRHWLKLVPAVEDSKAAVFPIEPAAVTAETAS